MREIRFLLVVIFVTMSLASMTGQAAAADTPLVLADKAIRPSERAVTSLADWTASVSARGAVVSQIAPLDDGCVRTIEGRWAGSNKIDSVWVGNICDITFKKADVHAFNGWAFDQWHHDVDVPPMEGQVFAVGMHMAWGSLLCGEIWSSRGLEGRDCVTI